MISPELNFNLFSSDLSLYLKNQVKVELFGSGVGLSLVLGFSAAYACYYLISVAKVRWLYIGVGTVHIHLQMNGLIRMLVHVIGSYLQRCIFAAVDRVSQCSRTAGSWCHNAMGCYIIVLSLSEFSALNPHEILYVCIAYIHVIMRLEICIKALICQENSCSLSRILKHMYRVENCHKNVLPHFCNSQ